MMNLATDHFPFKFWPKRPRRTWFEREMIGGDRPQ
jgi:hypothetical protein